MNLYYFGCVDKASSGHRLIDTNGLTVRESALPKDFPVRISVLDSGLLGLGREQGPGAKLSWIGGWTIISYWDMSADPRPGSNSNFIMKGNYPFHQATEFAKMSFPEIWNRARITLTQGFET